MSRKYNGVYLDDDAVAILRFIWNHQREATTREITHSTEIELEDNDKVRYRFDKLDDADLVNVEQSNRGGRGHPPMVSQLTDDGVEAIRQGLLGDIFDSSIDSQGAKIAELESRIQDVERQINRHDELIDEVGAEVYDIIPRLVACWRALEDNDVTPYNHLSSEKYDPPEWVE